MRLNAQEYFKLPEHELDLIELIDGEVVLGKPSYVAHQRISGNILVMLMAISRSSGAKVYMRPTEVHIDSHVFEPDLFYMTHDTQCELTELRVIGAPELVVEILSPSTARYDRQQKYKAYEKNGVQEYWIVDPVHETIEVWTLKKKKFVRQGAFGKDDTFKSTILNKEIDLKPIFSD